MEVADRNLFKNNFTTVPNQDTTASVSVCSGRKTCGVIITADPNVDITRSCISCRNHTGCAGRIRNSQLYSCCNRGTAGRSYNKQTCCTGICKVITIKIESDYSTIYIKDSCFRNRDRFNKLICTGFYRQLAIIIINVILIDLNDARPREAFRRLDIFVVFLIDFNFQRIFVSRLFFSRIFVNGILVIRLFVSIIDIVLLTIFLLDNIWLIIYWLIIYSWDIFRLSICYQIIISIISRN